LRHAALAVAALAVLALLQPIRAPAAWWKRGPADFEECSEAASKAGTKEEKTSALADCNAKFAGRRKPGGGYTYYDFMQDRSFDLAGPNPTPEEQKYIDQQYSLYLEKQRRSNIEAAISAKQQQEQLAQQQARPVQPASLRTDVERVPMPQARPSKKLIAGSADSRTRCAEHAFSCEWPRLSETINDVKKFFNGTQAQTKSGKKG
jgi:hypothetical protein